MSAYIDKTFMENMLSVTQVDVLLGYGGTTSTSTKNARMDQMISGSSSVIDSFLMVAGYTVPLTTVPDSIKKVCGYLVINDLYNLANQPLPTGFTDQLTEQHAFLNAIKDKQFPLPGVVQNPHTGTGGAMFNFGVSGSSNVGLGNTGTNATNRILSIDNLRGSYF